MTQRRFLTLLAMLLSSFGELGAATLQGTGGWQSTVDDLAAFQDSLQIPDHFVWDGDGARTGEEFDVNQYFSVLDRISMEDGYVLDYVYCKTSIGGGPRLYARPNDRNRLIACSELDPSANYLDQVRANDIEEGFFQLVLLKVVGEQFYLFWHAGDNDHRVICESDKIEEIIQADRTFRRPFSSEQKRAARRIDPTPRVELGKEKVTVEIVTFTDWGGFFRRTYEINRSFPHNLLQTGSEVLVEYQVGIIF